MGYPQTWRDSILAHTRCWGKYQSRDPYRNPRLRQSRLGFGDGMLAEMEDRGGQHGAGMAFADAGHQVVESPDPARGDDGNADRIGDRAGEREVVARPGPVPVHGGEQDLAGAEFGHPLGPCERDQYQ